MHKSGDVEMHQMRCGELEMHKEQAVSTSYRTHCTQAVFLIALVLYLLCTCISHWQKIYKHSQIFLYLQLRVLIYCHHGQWTQRSSLKCVQDMSPGSVQDLKVLSHFLCSTRLPFITLTAVRQRVGTVSLENYLYLPFSGFSTLSSQGSPFFCPPSLICISCSPDVHFWPSLHFSLGDDRWGASRDPEMSKSERTWPWNARNP